VVWGKFAISRWWLLLPIAAALGVTATILFVRYFPFSEKNVTRTFGETFPGNYQFSHFKNVYFPRPGCTAEGVTFRSSTGESGAALVVTAQKLSLRGSYAGLLFHPHYVSRMLLEGLRVQIPPPGHAGDFFSEETPSRTTIGELVADGAVVEIARTDNQPPLKFEAHELRLSSVSANAGMAYRVDMHNPEPPGEITSAGHFGPFHNASAGQTPLSGNFSFDRGDLGVFDGISGFLTSTGSFSGPLANIQVQGAVDVPDFEVVRSGHAGPLQNRFSATVNGTNGDVTLNRVNAVYGKTQISASGTVSHQGGRNGKFTSLDFTVRDGRIQDVLRIFVSENRPPMSGVTSFTAHVNVPPDGKPFLEEVGLQGDFEIVDGRFEKPSTQANVNELSATASGKKKAQQTEQPNNPQEDVNAETRGHVVLHDAVATLTDLSFVVPGADARMHGTFNLLNQKIDFHGNVKMDANFSQQTSGIKSVFAKVLDPIFKKKNGSVVPVVMDGTYGHPHFGVDLNPVK
jgi:hypothetical protein